MKINLLLSIFGKLVKNHKCCSQHRPENTPKSTPGVKVRDIDIYIKDDGVRDCLHDQLLITLVKRLVSGEWYLCKSGIKDRVDVGPNKNISIILAFTPEDEAYIKLNIIGQDYYITKHDRDIMLKFFKEIDVFDALIADKKREEVIQEMSNSK